MTATDLVRGGQTPDDAQGNAGLWTLMMLDGRYTWDQTFAADRSRGQFSGTYVTDGDRVSFTDGADSSCLGWSWSARWRIDGVLLRLSDVRTEKTPSCVSTGYEPLVKPVVEAHPWQALAHHESVG